MNKAAGIIGGLGLGAGVMYFLDPSKGRRRRALVSDKGARWLHVSRRAMGKTSEDLANRVRGIAHSAASRMSREEVSDDVLVERVRSKIGRVAGHPRAIEARAKGGRITLGGPVLKHELNEILSAVSSVPGVKEVRNEMEVYTRAEGVPDLQGRIARRGERRDIVQKSWTPALRALAGAAGTGLLAFAARNRRAPGSVAGVVGAGLLTRAIANQDIWQLGGAGRRGRGTEIQKTLNINAPVEEVYRFWTNYQNFPRFMTHLREVRDLGGRRSHWVAAGPAGTPVSWDAEITESVANKVLGWKSLPGSQVEHVGTARFDANPNGSTRLTIRMSYHPPAGAMGHAVASLFGADPKHEFDEDLIRLKSLLERGKTRAHGQTILREQL